MKYNGILLTCSFLALGMLACRNMRNKEKPALSQKEMVPIIYELMLSEEYATQLKGRDSTIQVEDLSKEKYDQVFQLHQTSQKEFKESYAYYLGHPDQIKAIYDSIDAEAKRRRLQIMNPAFKNREKPKRGPVKLKKDSVQ
ncbi:DUF4296 domain-containing protein [Flavihumibacter fluvii]|uniref:DUF4296 domain-containing protein n=1 Tax=Flavihumibacter fluvii TaxID=2838157 RepID=UPI001BDE1357|nr:DUF4296 domain-containing protein [Flavihumibacter fluvii]ULQ52886.1 DUF4296 domain-containing protein [Flavihumibacter fluvii]